MGMPLPKSPAFALFKELFNTCIVQSSHPMPSLNKVVMLFAHLKSAGYKFPANIQMMLLLAKLPPYMYGCYCTDDCAS